MQFSQKTANKAPISLRLEPCEVIFTHMEDHSFCSFTNCHESVALPGQIVNQTYKTDMNDNSNNLASVALLSINMHRNTFAVNASKIASSLNVKQSIVSIYFCPFSCMLNKVVWICCEKFYLKRSFCSSCMHSTHLYVIKWTIWNY